MSQKRGQVSIPLSVGTSWTYRVTNRKQNSRSLIYSRVKPYRQTSKLGVTGENPLKSIFLSLRQFGVTEATVLVMALRQFGLTGKTQ